MSTAPAPRIRLLLLGGGFLLLGGALRFTALGEVGLFVDEGGHLLAPVDADVRRVIDPVAEGKPAMAWLFAPAHGFPLDPLVVARGLVALLGLGTAAALAVALHAVAGARAGLLGLALWALCPFAVFHERLALLDPAVGFLTAAGLALLARALRTDRTPSARLRGAVLGAGLAGTAVAVKVSALALAPALGVVLLALAPRPGRLHLAALAAYLAPAALLFAALPGLGQRLPVAAAAPPPLALWSWTAGYGGWPLAVLGAAALAGLAHPGSGRRTAAGFALAALLAFGVAQALYPVPYARYLHGEHVLLVGALALGLDRWRSRFALAPALIAAVGWLWTDLALVRDPARAPVPRAERVQYVSGPWSGDGVAAALVRVRAETARGPAVVFVRRYSRPASYAAVLAARRDPALHVVPLSLDTPTGLAGARAVAARARALLGPAVRFLVLADGEPRPESAFLAAAEVGARVLWTHAKPDGGAIDLLEIVP